MVERATADLALPVGAGRRVAASYVSADTAPAGYAVGRSPWTAFAFVIVFGVLSVALVPCLDRLTAVYAAALGAAAVVAPGDRVLDGSLAFRPFVGVLLVVLAAFAVGRWRDRLRLLAFSWAVYAVAVIVLDLSLLAAMPLGVPAPLSPVPGIVAGLLGLVVVVLAVFTQYRLPTGVRVARRRRRPRVRAGVDRRAGGRADARQGGL